MTVTRRPLLEVIVITSEDAIQAERGGADRLEVVREIRTGGLTPEIEQFRRIREATQLPLRVMLRNNEGFRATPLEVESLSASAGQLRRDGAEAFVFGFLDAYGALDRRPLERLIVDTAPCPWTLHHAFDHTVDHRAAWNAVEQMPDIDTVLSGGIQGNLRLGLPTLFERASWQTSNLRWLAGGGLILDYVRPLLAAGIDAFHIGRAARPAHDWDQPVKAETVRQWRDELDQAFNQFA